MDRQLDQVTRSRSLWAILGIGLFLRLLLIGNDGFHNDISAFEGWALQLAAHPFSEFYSPARFADYPPGYLYVLAFVGHLYAPFQYHDPTGFILKALLKLPAILMDLFDAGLVYAIALRFADVRTALIGAALIALNPAVIYISAAWGQVDSIAGGLALLGIWLLLRSEDEDARPRLSWLITLAWLALAYSILIKPQAAILLPLFVAFAFLPRGSRLRLSAKLATAAGILAALLLAWLVTLPFHPTINPVDSFVWLIDKYTYGKNVYPYNSVNAFNLWTIKFSFWQPDSQTILRLPQYVWGLLLLAAATALILVRYLHARTPRALLEAAALLLLAFYLLSTRMHERYLFDGLLFLTPLLFAGRRYFWCAVLLSATLFADLMYSLQYIHVVEQSIPNTDARDLMPLLTRPLSLFNLASFFYLGYVFLGTVPEAGTAAAPPVRIPLGRKWFDPREGLTRMRWPLDYLLAGVIGIFSFVLSYVNYWLPNEKIFDEIYFARAGEEYLKHVHIYESTHPPLTKLLVTLSIMLFGGLTRGDNPTGWRFLDVVFGALVVVVLYLFAKRITRSSLFASIAALLLVFDGMHFVQSRIATPEGFVVFFSVATLYAFYRFWIASQVQIRSALGERGKQLLAAGVAITLGAAATVAHFGFIHDTAAAQIAAGAYLWLGFYLIARLIVVPRLARSGLDFISYPEGSYALRSGGALEMHLSDGSVVNRQNPSLVRDDGDLRIQYTADGTIDYSSPAGSAIYTPGRMVADTGESEDGRAAKWWLVVFVLLLGCLVSSKWYGVMAYGVSIAVILTIWIQQHLAHRHRPALWGNPFGFPLDITLGTLAFLSATVYALVWIPAIFASHDITDPSSLISRQVGMYVYHSTLVATHPYSSLWWQWPLDLRPIAYYYHDFRAAALANMPQACCIREIISLPNPLILWPGLISLPLVGYLGWRERNKGYVLLVLAYLLQWLPWARSPRIAFAYHFYVNIPLICLCNAILLQRLWAWWGDNREGRLWRGIAVGGYVGAVAIAFIFFYPVLAGSPLPWNQWDQRMWHHLMGNAWI
ncbi:MAG: phospholipid carrier-dependent glycosyltransferase [Candidatus Baltobacteraceae bacterium]